MSWIYSHKGMPWQPGENFEAKENKIEMFK